MKQLFWSSLFILLFHNSFSQPHEETLIRNLENLERKAILEKDTIQLYRLMSPNIVVQNPENVIVRFQQIIDRIREGRINYAFFERKIDQVNFVNGIAIVMGLETIIPHGDTPNAGKTIKRRFTNIWIKENDNWKLCARQATIVPAN